MPYTYPDTAQFDAEYAEAVSWASNARREFVTDPAFAIDSINEAICNLIAMREIVQAHQPIQEEWDMQQYDENGDYLALPAPSTLVAQAA